MGLKEGTLESLVERDGGLPTPVADSVFLQILQALDYLTYNGIVHRDMKPENILYVSQPGGQYQFQLGDFGLCNRVVDAATFTGSRMYMAPEMFRKRGQTSKLDVWSLFVTILWTLDTGGFRQKSSQFKSIEDVQETVLFVASNIDSVSKIRKMASVNPKERASATQLLVKYYNGVGLSTPRNQVSELISSPKPSITFARTPTLAIPAPINQIIQTKPRGFRKKKNIFAAAQYRVEKARDPLQPQRFRRLEETCPKPYAKG
jgi:serine/threonine protein kinase